MRVDGGGFAASLDADSDGEEGLFYTWDHAEIEAVLADDAAIFFASLHLRSAARLGRQADHPRNADQQHWPCRRRRMAPLLAKLFAAREKRVRPGRDDKVLTDWNGLMIAALAEAARQP